jgi:hypothetical protein
MPAKPKPINNWIIYHPPGENNHQLAGDLLLLLDNRTILPKVVQDELTRLCARDGANTWRAALDVPGRREN